LLTKLSDLRQLNDSHTEYNLKLEKNEVQEIQEQLGNLNLNPYPRWELVKGGNNDSTPVPGPSSGAGYKNQDSPTGVISASSARPNNNVCPGNQREAMKVMFMSFMDKRLPEMMDDPMIVPSFEADIMQMSSFFKQNRTMAAQLPTAHNSAPIDDHRSIPTTAECLMQQPIRNQHGFPPNTNTAMNYQFQEQFGTSSTQHCTTSTSSTLDPNYGYTTPQYSSYEENVATTTAAPNIMGMMSQSEHIPQREEGIPQFSQMTQVLKSIGSTGIDSNLIQKVKESLSPDVLSSLSSIFGAGSEEKSSTSPFGSFDLNKIPPNLINAFLGTGEGSNLSDVQGNFTGFLAPPNLPSDSDGHNSSEFSTGVDPFTAQLEQIENSVGLDAAPNVNLGLNNVGNSTESTFLGQSQQYGPYNGQW